MKNFTLLIFLIVNIFIINNVLAEDAEEIKAENDVLILTDKNFDLALKKYPFILVKFYAPWCGHCKQLAPEYEKAAKKIQSKYPDGSVALGHVDSTVEKQIASRFEISGYPTLRFFVDGQKIDYEGGRTEDTIVEWIDKLLSKQEEKINNQQQLDEFLGKSQVSVVYFGSDLNDKSFQFFSNVNKVYDEFSFAYTMSSELKEKYAPQNDFGIVLFKSFDSNPNLFEDKDLNSTSFQNFLYSNSLPKVASYNKIVKTRLYQKKQKSLVIFYSKNDQLAGKAMDALNAVQDNLADKLLLVNCQITETLCKEFANELGIESLDTPTARIVVPKEYRGGFSQYFIEHEPDTITSDILLQFYDDYKSEKLIPSLKTEDIPEHQEQVLRVVGRTFNSIVGDKNKDVLVFFHQSEDDDKYKTIKKAFDEAAKRCAHMPDLAFAFINMNKNQIENQYFREFPAIRFFSKTRKLGPANFNKEVKALTGEQIIDFLREKATIDWLEPDIFGEADEKYVKPQPKTINDLKKSASKKDKKDKKEEL